MFNEPCTAVLFVFTRLLRKQWRNFVYCRLFKANASKNFLRNLPFSNVNTPYALRKTSFWRPTLSICIQKIDVFCCLSKKYLYWEMLIRTSKFVLYVHVLLRKKWIASVIWRSNDTFKTKTFNERSFIQIRFLCLFCSSLL